MKLTLTDFKGPRILWDFIIQTDWKIKYNKSDIEVKDYKRKTCLLIDMSEPTDKNISVKEYDKIDECKNQETEIETYGTLKLLPCQ